MLRLGGCPRCNGAVYSSPSDADGEPTCLQCGWVDYGRSVPPALVNKTSAARVEARSRSRNLPKLTLLTRSLAEDAPPAEYALIPRRFVIVEGR